MELCVREVTLWPCSKADRPHFVGWKGEVGLEVASMLRETIVARHFGATTAGECRALGIVRLVAASVRLNVADCGWYDCD